MMIRNTNRGLKVLARQLSLPPCDGETGMSSKALSSTAGRITSTLSRRSLFQRIGCAFAAVIGAPLLPQALAGGPSSRMISTYRNVPIYEEEMDIIRTYV